MVQRSQSPGFALKARERLAVICHSRRQNFQGHITSQLRIAGTVHLAHPALTKLGRYLVLANPATRSGYRRRHACVRFLARSLQSIFSE